MLEPIEHLCTDTTTKEDVRPDWSMKCQVCGASPIVPLTCMCGPCTWGEADTINGGWWDEGKDEMK